MPTQFFVEYGIHNALHKNKGLRTFALLNIKSVDKTIVTASAYRDQSGNRIESSDADACTWECHK